MKKEREKREKEERKLLREQKAQQKRHEKEVMRLRKLHKRTGSNSSGKRNKDLLNANIYMFKNMTVKARPKLEEIADCMKKLSESKLGEFKQLTQKERAYYKPLPEDNNKEALLPIIGSGKWEDYVFNFKTSDVRYITATQHNRLLRQFPYCITERMT